MAFMHQDMGYAHFTSESSVFSVIAAVVLMPILLCNGQNIAEYKANWLMGFPIINH